MSKKRLLKSMVAMVALVAMLMENTYSVMASVVTDNIISSDDNVITFEDSDDVVTGDESGSDVLVTDKDSEVISVDEDAPAKEIDISIGEENDDLLVSSEESVNASDDKIEVTGSEEVTLYVNTDQMNSSDSFKLSLKGSDSLDYSIVLDGRMSKSDSDVYTIKGLEGKKLTIKATDLSSGMTAQYKVRKDGNPQISLISEDEPEAVKKLRITDSGDEIKGSGYDSIILSLDASALKDSNLYNLYIDTKADVKYNGDLVEDGQIASLSKSTSSIRLSNLDNKAFTIYIEGHNTKKIKADYTIDSIDNGAVNAVISLDSDDITIDHEEDEEEADEEEAEEAVKRVYSYEDADVSVTATLQYADAIPDDAEFVVTRVTADTAGYNYDAYIEAMSNNAEKILGEEGAVISASDVLLYDVAFYGKDEDGNRVELQPEEGSVAVSIRFKKDQIENELSADTASDVKTVHLPLVEEVKNDVDSTAEATSITASDIKVELVSSSASSDKDGVDFTLSDFSVIAITAGGKILPGPDETFKTVLGNACVHGVVANYLNASGHFETNFAAGTLDGGANVSTCKNANGNAGVTYVGEYVGQNFFMDSNSENKSQALLYTTREALTNMHSSMAVPKNQTRAVVRNGGVIIDLRYSKSDIKNRVSSLVSKAAAKSKELAAVDSYSFSSVANGGVLDIASRGSGKGTYYITFEKGEYAKKAGGLDIRLAEGQNVVLTIPDEEISFYQMKVNGYAVGGQPEEDSICQRVVLNCPNAKSVVTGGSVAAVVLVPNGKFQNNTVSAGWVVANEVTGFGSEWHCVWHDMPPADGTTDIIKAKKTVNWNTPSKKQKFKFGLYSYDQKSGEYKLVQEVQNSGEEIVFDPIYFNEEGTYKYKVIEHEQDDQFSHDPTEYIIDYTIQLDKGLNQYVIKSKTVKKSTSSQGATTKCADPEIKFNNQDKAKVPFDFNISKLFYVKDGTDWNSKKLIESYEGFGEPWPDGAVFDFKLERFDGGSTNSGIRTDGPLPDTLTLRLTKDKRSGSFGKVYFEADTNESHYGWWEKDGGRLTKTYMYKVTEIIPKDEDKIPGIYYTTRPVYIKLFVTSWYDWSTNSTKVEVTGRASFVNDNSIQGQECFPISNSNLEFVNAYYPGSLKVKKVAQDQNGNKVDSDKDFHVVVYRETSNGSKVYYGVDGKSYLNVHTETIKGNSEINFYPLPVGYRYYVYETDEYGVKITGDGTAYSVTYSGNLDKNNSFELKNCDRSKCATITNKRAAGKIRLIKWDANKTKKLAGAKFVLYKDGKRYPDSKTEYTVDGSGTVEVDNLPWGTYYFVETKAPEGYKLPEGDKAKTSSVVIDESTVKTVRVIEVTDEEIVGDMLLKKVDDKGKALAGAQFKLYASNNDNATANQIKTSGSNGTYKYDPAGSYQVLDTDQAGLLKVTGLPYGKYAVQETKAPANHIKVDEARGFTIDGSKATVELTFVNPEISANVEFIKVDPSDQPVEGITFILYKKINGTYEAIDSAVSGKNGHVLVQGLGEGEYYFQEDEKSVVGYVYDGTKHSFDITAADNGTTKTLPGVYRKVDGLAAVENTPLPGTVELLKYVLKGKDKLGLRDAEFELWKINPGKSDKKVNTYTTDSDGKITVTGLEWGSYYFVESKAPTGFNPVKDKKYFEITRTKRDLTGLAGRIEVENTPIKGKVQLEKVDSKDKNKKLSGVAFDLYKGTPEAPGELVGSYVTGATVAGMISKDDVGELEYGNYYFMENPANSTLLGYQLTSKPVSFTISEQDKLIKLVVENDRKPGKVTLQKYDGSRLKKLDGAKFDLYKVPEGFWENVGSFVNLNKIDSFETANGGVIEVTGLEWGSYYFEETEAPEGYIKSNEQYRFNISVSDSEETLEAFVEVTDPEDTGAIKLIKDDEYGNKLSGATFVLYKDGNRYPDMTKEYVTDDKGEIFVDNLPWGTYYFEETGVPEGYVVPADPNTEEVVINEKTTVQTVKFHTLRKTNDEIHGNLEVTKVDDQHNGLLGAEFYITRLVGEDEKNVKFSGDDGHYSYDRTAGFISFKQVLKTDGSKLYVTGLPYGSYFLYEDKAPLGHNKVSTPFAFTISEDDAVITYDFVNTPVSAAVEFIKADTDLKKLEGAVFKLYKYTDDAKTVELAEDLGEVHDVKGVFKKDGLGVGNYFFKEIKAPKGYKLVDGLYEFTITDDDNGKTVRLKTYDKIDDKANTYVIDPPEMGKVRLFKAEAGTNNGLKGALFDLYSEKDDKKPLVTGLESDEQGYVRAEDLEWGKYYFVETKAPYGYAKDNNKHWFEVNVDNASAEVWITKDIEGNELRVDEPLILAGADLIKQDADTEDPIEGAEFALFYNDGTDSMVAGYEKMTTGRDGKITTRMDLREGSYYFKEIKPADGYIGNDKHYEFSVNEANMNTVIHAGDNGVVYNPPILGEVELFKFSKDGQDNVIGLQDAKFTLRRKRFLIPDEVIGTYTTDANGIISKDNLKWGEYYFTEDEAPAGYTAPKNVDLSFKIDAKQQKFTLNSRLTCENPPIPGKVRLIKYLALNGDKKVTLEGAKFRFYKRVGSDKEEIRNTEDEEGLYTTDKDGVIVIEDLAWGTYFFDEVSAPKGCVLPKKTTSEDITINAKNVEASIKTPLTVEVTNKKVYGNASLIKINDEKPAKGLKGAQFELYTENDELVYLTEKNGAYYYSEEGGTTRLVSPEGGEIFVKQLPYGNYYFVEKVAPANYVKTDAKLGFTIDKDQNEDDEPQVHLTCINTPIFADVEFIKADTDIDHPLEGCTFALYMKGAAPDGSDAYLGDIVSDENGIVSRKGLNVGEYYFKEVKTKDDAYTPYSGKLEFVIEDKDKDQTVGLKDVADNTVINTPIPGSIKLIKYYTFNGSREGTIKGAEFNLYQKNKNGVYELYNKEEPYVVRNDDGILVVKNLPWGSYFFKETKAPAGHTADLDYEYHFEITKDDIGDEPVKIIQVDNARKPGRVEINKIDSKHQTAIDGVIFHLYMDYGTKDQKDLGTKSTVNGKVTWEGLAWGTYTLIEDESDAAHVADKTPRTFTIDASHLEEKYTGGAAIKNPPKEGYVYLEKKNKDTKEFIPSVEFILYKDMADGTSKKVEDFGRLITNAGGQLEDKDGNVKIGPLEYGDYHFEEVAQTGYLPLEQDLKFQIIEDGQEKKFLSDFAVVNTPILGAVKLLKVDENKAPLAGATFTLYSEESKSIIATLASLFSNESGFQYGEFITNSRGEITVTGLPWGSYYFKETKAAPGYDIPEPKDKHYEFTIDAQTTGTTIPIGPIGNPQLPGKLELTKVDSKDNSVIKNAKFKLYRRVEGSDPIDVSTLYGAENGVFTTNDNGVIEVNDVAWGTYFFDEVESAYGYEPIVRQFQVTSKDLIIDATNWSDKDKIMLPQKDTVENVKGHGHVQLIKKFIGTQPDPETIKGIEFDLHNETTNEVKKFYTDKDGIISAKDIGPLEYGSYYFTEESVPAGSSYKVSDYELHFTISSSNPESDPIEYEFNNAEVFASAQFIKVDPFEYDYEAPTQKGTIAGIKFSVHRVDSTGDHILGDVESAADGLVQVTHLPIGSYYFLEDEDSARALGFVPSTDKYTFEITAADAVPDGEVEKFVDVYKNGDVQMKMETVPNPREAGKIRLEKLGRNINGTIKKVDMSTAEFELYQEGKGLIMTKEELAKLNTGDEIVVENLSWGRYYFKEITPPKGYALPEGDAVNSNVVEINGESVCASAVTPLTCSITDDTVRVYISKRGITGADELAGAGMTLYAANEKGEKTGSPILEWVSGTTPKLIEIGSEVKDGLEAGKSYVIHENAAPAGYAFAKDIPFTVNPDGSVKTDPAKCRVIGTGNGMTIIMDDGPVNVYISKKELGTDIALSGASLQIRDENGIVEAWSSTGHAHKVQAVLEIGKPYTLEEVNPPKGYYTAAPITFEVTMGGGVNILHDESASATLMAMNEATVFGGQGTSASSLTCELTMYDRPIKVEISKKRLSGSDKDYVQGAQLTLFELDGDLYKPVASWESAGDKAYSVEYGLLKVGGKYKVSETKSPAGYSKADDIFFTVKDFDEFEKTDSDGTVTQKETIYDPPIKVVVSKKAITGNDELPGALLQIVDENGAEMAKFTSSAKQTLITSIESAEKLSADEKASYSGYNVVYNVKFETGKTYTLKELSAPAGYALAKPVDFTIDENGNQAPSPVVMRDKPIEIKISKKDIGSGKNLAGASLELYNEAGDLVAEWLSSDKPVLFSVREISAEEAAGYAQVIAKILPAGKYRLHEAKAPEGYKLADDVTITLTGANVRQDNGEITEESMYDYKEGTTSLIGKKAWIEPKDNEGNIEADYTYPDLTIKLYRDSAEQGKMDTEPYRTLKLENGATTFAFGDLERYKTGNGQNYEYTYDVYEEMSVEEEPHYTQRKLEIKKEGDQKTVVFMAGFENILNQEYTDLKGVKTFTLLKDKDGKILKDVKYDDITIWLLQNGKRVDTDEDGKEDCVNIAGGAKETNGVAEFTFKRLPKYDLTTGNAYKYTIEESGSDNYIYNIIYNDDEVKINNIPKASPFDIKGIKTWIDPDAANRPDVTIQLYRDGKLYKETKLSKNNTFTFEGLYEYNLGYGNDEGDIGATADGHKFLYEVKEAGALGYDVKISGSGDELEIKNGVAEVSIKNTIKQVYGEISGNKYWNDKGDSSKRPAVTINLYATDSTGRKDELVDTYVIPNTSNRYEFGTKGRKQLPKYDANGKEIVYTVKEEELKGYISEKDGYDFINTPSKVVVSKLDATEHTELPGAVLSITRKSDGKEVERWTSGSTPHYIEALEIGEVYILTEISAPLGYAVASPVEFQVGVNGVEQKVEMFDDPIIGSVTLTKLDAENHEKLAGAVFNLYSSDGNILYATGSDGNYTFSKTSAGGVKDLEVNGAGELKVDKMPYGSYYFKEVKAPKGYELKSETVSFSITDHGVNVTVSYEDPRILGAVTLRKTNADETRSLAGAEFELYSRTPRTTGQAAASTVFSDAYYRYGTYTTDSDGRIKVDKLPWDDYYFIETKAPEGYTTNRDITGDPIVYTFSIGADNAGATAVDLGTITNEEIETGVLGERIPMAEKVSGVLGVRSKPTAGVLGTRVGPATGDAGAIALWLTLLAACVVTIVWMLTSKKKKGLEK